MQLFTFLSGLPICLFETHLTLVDAQDKTIARYAKHFLAHAE